MGLVKKVNIDDLIYTSHLDNTLILTETKKEYLKNKEKITNVLIPIGYHMKN